MERAGPWAFATGWREQLEAELRAAIEAQTHSTRGVPVPSEPWASDVVPLLGFERRGAKLYLPGAAPSLGAREAEAAVLEQRLAEAGVAAVKLDDHELAKFLERDGRLVRLGEEHAIGRTAYEEAKRALVAEATATGEITLGRFRDLIGSGRRDAQLLLERFDADGVTRRIGDRRVLRRSARQP